MRRSFFNRLQNGGAVQPLNIESYYPFIADYDDYYGRNNPYNHNGTLTSDGVVNGAFNTTGSFSPVRFEAELLNFVDDLGNDQSFSYGAWYKGNETVKATRELISRVLGSQEPGYSTKTYRMYLAGTTATGTSLYAYIYDSSNDSRLGKRFEIPFYDREDWNHFAFSYDASTHELLVFVNGVPGGYYDNSGVFGQKRHEDIITSIGRFADTSGGNFLGAWCEPFFLNQAMNEATCKYIYDQNLLGNAITTL